MQRADVGWTAIARTVRSFPISTAFLLSCSEQALRRFSYLFHRGGNEGTEVTHLLKATWHGRSRSEPRPPPHPHRRPTPARNSARPTHCSFFFKPPLAPGILQRERIQNELSVSLVLHRQLPSLALPSCSHAKP